MAASSAPKMEGDGTVCFPFPGDGAGESTRSAGVTAGGIDTVSADCVGCVGTLSAAIEMAPGMSVGTLSVRRGVAGDIDVEATGSVAASGRVACMSACVASGRRVMAATANLSRRLYIMMRRFYVIY